MCYAIEFHKFFKFITGKNCSVITDNNIWNAMSGSISANSDFGKRGLIFAAKLVQPDQFWQQKWFRGPLWHVVLPQLGQPDQF